MEPRRLVFSLTLIAAVALIANPWLEPHIIFGNGSSMPGLAIALWIIAIIGMCAAAPIIFLTDAGIYTIQSTVSTGRYTLAVIAKDYGATDEGHTDVTQICRIVPGVMLSRNLRRNASLEAPPINILSRDRVMIDGWIIDLRPMIWPLC